MLYQTTFIRSLLGAGTALCFLACNGGGDAAPPEAAEPEAVAEPEAEAPTIDPNADTSLPGDPVAGAPIYARVCLACHGSDGRGNGGIGGDFAQPERLQQDNAVLINTITNGSNVNGRVMPPQSAVLSEQEIKDVLSYIRQEFGE